MWINGAFAAWVLDHEFGHNYGLPHAGSRRTTDGTIIGQGIHDEGGYTFDVMGGGGTLTSELNHFNVSSKYYLNWLTDTNVQTATTDGVYRIFAQDSFNPGGIRALKIRKDSTKNYWVEFRQLFTNNPAAMNGAIISWVYPNGNLPEVELLDMTPDTATGIDSPLLIGQSFYDNVNRIKITVIGKGNTTPESLDVRVELNVGCAFTTEQTIQNVPSSGGEGLVNVNTQSGCSAPVASSNDWIFGVRVDDATGAVHYIASANYSSHPRTGTITIAGQTITVNQPASATACVSPPSGLDAWWRGEGNALDETKLNNGTLINNILFTGGKVGGGFKGGSIGTLFQVPDSPSLTLTTSMTFEGWIRLDSYESGRVIIERRDDTSISGNGAPSYIIYPLPTGELVFFIYTTPSTGGGVVSPNPLPLGQFVHFAATRDEATSQVKLYINGTLVRQITMPEHPQNLNPNANPRINIGNINGITDELSVYNRALTTSEIQTIYNAGTAATGSIGKCLLRTSRTPFDFDGDGKSDISVFRPSNGAWYLQQSASGFTGSQFGISTDKLVPADYDGDGKTDIAVYRAGIWYLQRSAAGFTGISFGDSGDIPQPADFDGDGKAEIAVFRPSNGTWYVLNLATNQFNAYQFGASTDKPVVGDYDGDGKADYAVYRPSNGTWYLQRSSAGFTGMQFGDSNDKPVAADYDGDGKTDIAVFRPSNGTWYLQRSQFGFTGVQFGISTDLPTPADYDGDGKADIAVFRTGTWYLLRSTSGFTGVQFGAATDKPVPNAIVP